jgi:two-component system response regulator AtoC
MSNAGTEDKPGTVLVADDEPTIRLLFESVLNKSGFNVLLAVDGEDLFRRVSEETAVVILDMNMPGKKGLECLAELKEIYPSIQVIMITADDDVQSAVRAMKQGAFDYMTKPFNPEELISVVSRAINVSKLAHENDTLRNSLSDASPKIPFFGISAVARELNRKIEKIASQDATVLLSGENGTGKSLIARMIHYTGPFSEKPFVTVNCSALPPDLVESEVFGHEKGAFTGAHQRRLGRIEVAGEGTLFLDEIGDMPLDLQLKLLTFLKERRFHRVGGTETIHARGRIICATSGDLRRMCDEGKFREDLFYRLNVLPLHMPTLRERPEDIGPLADYFLSRLNQNRVDEIKPVLSEPVQVLLKNYCWQGNIRELQNTLERAHAFCENGLIEPGDLPVELTGGAVMPNDSIEAATQAGFLAGMTLKEIERLAIEQALLHCQGNKAQAARELGISEKSIYNKMHRFGLFQPARR